MYEHLIAPLRPEIKAYEGMLDSLKKHHAGKFVIIKGGELRGVYDTFDTAARNAIREFGAGPYLIREVAERRVMRMPSSVFLRPPACL